MKISYQILFVFAVFWTLSVSTAAPIEDETIENENHPDFLLRRRLDDGEEELFVYAKGSWASRLSLSHPDLYSVSLVMSTDGSNLVKSIYNSDGELVDCDILENEESIQKFIADLQSNVNDASKSTSTTNGTLTFLDSDNVILEDDEQKILNVDVQKRQCKKLQRSTPGFKKGKSSKRRLRRSKRSYLIYPGTNWCGKGNNAEYAMHMGLNSEEDKCCRTHDQCPFAIEGFSSRFNIFNYRLHTLSHCDCDKA